MSEISCSRADLIARPATNTGGSLEKRGVFRRQEIGESSLQGFNWSQLGRLLSPGLRVLCEISNSLTVYCVFDANHFMLDL